MFRKLYHPEIFQGNLRKRNYFEGWYFKHVTQDLSGAFSFIPGVSLIRNDPHAFIQIINSASGITHYVRYGPDEFRWHRKELFLQVGSSVFTGQNMILDINNEDVVVKGQIDYRNVISYPGSLFSPGIMGWYSFVPFMECNHGIVSALHDLRGILSFNGELIDFGNGKGYIEKDWGTSFPECWIWMQSNSFSEPCTSFSFSVAKIPWLGRFFIGFIGFLYFDDKFYLFSTYNGSVISEVNNEKDHISITLSNKRYILKIRAMKKGFLELRAPVSGEMSRRIKESMDSELFIRLYDRHNNLKYEDRGDRAGLEIIEKIFSYF